MSQHEPIYRRLSLGDRIQISALRKAGFSNREIGQKLGRSPSTISREVKRNKYKSYDDLFYTSSKAQGKSNARQIAARNHGYIPESTWVMVRERLAMYWSPQQIAGWLKRQAIKISHESIYRYIYNDKDNGGTLHELLRQRRRKRRKRWNSRDRRGRLEGKRMIASRPIEIEDRKDIGHWEVDTMVGRGSKTCLVTLVERKSGYGLIRLIPNRTAHETTKAIVAMITTSDMPFKTITADNGSEFHSYKEIERATGVTIYFANPYHSWERGSNENFNGLVRGYIPKGTSMNGYTQAFCERISDKLNDRPRRRLRYLCPREVTQPARGGVAPDG